MGVALVKMPELAQLAGAAIYPILGLLVAALLLASAASRYGFHARFVTDLTRLGMFAGLAFVISLALVAVRS